MENKAIETDRTNDFKGEDCFLSRKDAARFCGCSITTLDAMRSLGLIKAHRLAIGNKGSGKPVFRKKHLLEAISAL